MDLNAVAIAHIFVVSLFVWASAGISGGHINGAVSLAFLINRGISCKKFWLYQIAQMTGSLLAGVMLRLYLWNDHKYSNKVDRWPTVLGFPHANLKDWDQGTCFLVEIIGTFFLVMTVFLTAFNSTRPKSDIYGFAIGGIVGIFVLCIGPITGAALNPQRMLGPAIVSGDLFKSEYDYAWIYYIGDYLGGAIAGTVWWFGFADWNKNELVYEKKTVEEHEEVHDNLVPEGHKVKPKNYIDQHKGKVGVNNKKKLFITIVHDNLLEANGEYMVNLAGAKFDASSGREIMGDYVAKSTATLGEKNLQVKHVVCKVEVDKCSYGEIQGKIVHPNPEQENLKL